MKKIYPYLLVALTVLIPTTLWADAGTFDPFDATHKIYRNKYVTTNPNGTYTLDLETYATGYTKQTESFVATDFVLVLDHSGSMSSNNLRGEKVPNGTKLSTGSKYQLVDTNGRCYNLVWNSTDRRWRKCYNGATAITSGEGRDFSDVAQYAVDYENNSYEIYYLLDGTGGRATKTRLDALREAVVDFVGKVNENNATMKTEGATLLNRVAVVWYAQDGDIAGYNGKTSGSPDPFALNVIGSGTGAISYSSFCTAFAKEPSIGSSTYCNKGLVKAYNILKGAKNDKRNKVVVFFTDGEPGSTAGKFLSSVARNACAAAYNIKTDTDLFNEVEGESGNKKNFAPIIYSVGLMDSNTAYQHDGNGTIGNTTYNGDKYRFMHYVSSNYTGSLTSTYNFTSNVLGGGSEDPHDYFIRSYGPDLASAFAKIATRELKDRNENMTGSKTVVEDAMSDNFRLPAETVKSPSKIRLYTCDVDENNKADRTATPPYQADKVKWMTTGTGGIAVYKDADNKTLWKTGDAGSAPASYDHKEYWKPLTSATVSVPDNKTVSVKGYNFVEHFVGPIHDFTGATTDIIGWTGQKLIVEFEIEKDPSCPGGGNLDTNDADKSGVYVDGSLLSYYPKPDVGIPNIEVVVKGLNSTDGSAVFDIVKVAADGVTPVSENSYKATVILSSANNTALLTSVGYGYYRVTQKTWDWKHTVKYDSNGNGDIDEADQIGTSYVLHMEDPGSGDRPDKITFTFGNALKSGSLPDSDEKSVNNGELKP